MLDRDRGEFNMMEKEVLTDVLKTVEATDLQPDKGAVLIGTLQLFSQMVGCLNLVLAEKVLRELNSDLTLIAKPTAHFPGFRSRLPHTGDHDYPYLANAMQITPTVKFILQAFGLNEVENNRRLAAAGLAVPEPGSHIAFQAKAHLN